MGKENKTDICTLKGELGIPLTTEEKIILRIQADLLKIQQEKCIRKRCYFKSKEPKKIVIEKKYTVPQPFDLETSLMRKKAILTSEERVLSVIINRPKFKARKVPSFLYRKSIRKVGSGEPQHSLDTSSHSSSSQTQRKHNTSRNFY